MPRPGIPADHRLSLPGHAYPYLDPTLLDPTLLPTYPVLPMRTWARHSCPPRHPGHALAFLPLPHAPRRDLTVLPLLSCHSPDPILGTSLLSCLAIPIRARPGLGLARPAISATLRGSTTSSILPPGIHSCHPEPCLALRGAPSHGYPAVPRLCLTRHAVTFLPPIPVRADSRRSFPGRPGTPLLPVRCFLSST